MAERLNWSEAFRNDPQLQKFVLANVTPTGKVLGIGSYGSVEEVSYRHVICAGKKIHETLISFENEGVGEMIRRYLQECQLMSNLRHPNITQFLGICFLPESTLPILVMERLEISLDGLLEHMPNLPLFFKHSALEDVARGLLYLHCRDPPVIHRDLTTKNVLLTSSLVAKITDMGNSRIVSHGQMAETLSRCPGTLVYMPPETRDESGCYSVSMDVFSFGHLAIYTITQVFPGNLLPSTYVDSSNQVTIKARSEVERRQNYIELIERKLSTEHSCLVDLIKQCLHDNPSQRPSTEDLLTRLQEMKATLDQYGAPFRLDMEKVQLAMELKEKDRKMQELMHRQASHEAEMEGIKKTVEETTKQLKASIQARDEKIYQLCEQIQARERRLKELEAEVKLFDSTPKSKEKVMQKKEEEFQVNCDSMSKQQSASEQSASEQSASEMIIGNVQENNLQENGTKKEVDEVRETAVRKELEMHTFEITKLKEALRECQESMTASLNKAVLMGKDEYLEEFEIVEFEESLLQASLTVDSNGTDMKESQKFQFDWNVGPDMPFRMGYSIQSVLIDDKLYVGGGRSTLLSAYSPTDYVVMEFSVDSKNWATLPQYTSCYFTLAAIHNQLVLIGGRENDGSYSKMLGVWETCSNTWTHPYPDMPTARSQSSAVVYHEWLVVAGGLVEKQFLSCVEVMNVESKQWCSVPPIPVAWSNMRTVLIGDAAFFMGGSNSELDFKSTFRLCMKTLISHTSSQNADGTATQMWKEITSLKVKKSTPISYKGSLLAVGGRYLGSGLTAIRLYQPMSDEWVKVGNLPNASYNSTCAMIKDNEMLVAGGKSNRVQFLKRVDFASIM